MKRPVFIICISLLGSLFILVPFHLWLTNPKSLANITFPLEGFIAKQTISCSRHAPVWISDVIKHYINMHGAIANQISYIQNDGKSYQCQSGWISGVPLSTPVTENTRFRFASLTKTITADLILRLIEDDQLSLASTLSDIFPENKSYKDSRIPRINIAQLLNHTAGFDRTTLLGDEMFLRNKKPWCPYSIESLSNLKLMHSPGDKQVYSNTGYCLLGMIIARVTGQNYEDYAEHVYGLKKRGIEFVKGAFLPDEPKYDFRREFFFPENYYTWFDFNAISSSAGLSGNAAALAKLVWESVHSRRISLRRPSDYPGCDTHSFRGCYGFAVYHYSELDGALEVSIHEGYLPGASSFLMIDETGGVTVMLSSGGAANGFEDNKSLYAFVYKVLSKVNNKN